MVSDFLTSEWGRLLDKGPDDIIEEARVIFKPGINRDGWFTSANQLQQVDYAIDIFEGKTKGNSQGLFLFDNAPSHRKRAGDALSAKRMPKAPRAKWTNSKDGSRMRHGVNPLTGESQSFYFPDDHPTMPGWFKGMEHIIQERGLWPESGLLCSKDPNAAIGTPCAINELFTSWEKASTKSCYESFVPALNAGMAKLNTYYECSAESDAHILAMVLKPSMKLVYFHKHWSSDLVLDVEDTVQAKFIKCFNKLCQDPVMKSTCICKSSSRHKSVHPNIDNTGTKDNTTNCKATDIPSNVWMDEWKAYVNTHKDVPEAGIMISKQHNQLDSDIIKALQCLKALHQEDVTLRFIPSVANEETYLDNADMQSMNQEGSASEVVEGAKDWTWDEIGDNHSNSDGDGDVNDGEDDV
ncbi:hypothetical protein EI94DRAFT_1807644 [Lactarius quietus]|nr:hypothetical protein EI94DRAFT_1807644 [Lactarius quietus]